MQSGVSLCTCNEIMKSMNNLDYFLESAFANERVVSTSKKLLRRLLKAALLRTLEHEGIDARAEDSLATLVETVDSVTEGRVGIRRNDFTELNLLLTACR